MIVWIGIFVLALAFVATPVTMALAWRIGAVDVPRDARRMHCRTIPRAGGLAVFLAFCIGCTAWGISSRTTLAAIAGGAVMLMLGLTDDIFCLRAHGKLIFQLLTAAAAVRFGGAARGVSALWAVLWVVALTNAHNFIDGLDGLFAGCAAVEGCSLFAALSLCGMLEDAIPPLLLGLACLGFRHFNRHPAVVFAGDCGSATVGFLFGMLSLSLFGAGGGMCGISPLLLFAYPLCDLSTAVLRRVLRGKSPFSADRGHLHHRICDAGLSQVQCVRILIAVSAGFCAVGILSSAQDFFASASLCAAACACLLVYLRRYIEDFT